MAETKFDIIQYYNNLKRLFSNSGPVVKRRVANNIAASNQQGEPIGTARAFFKSANNLYATQLASYSNYTRMARYGDYNEMESMAEIHSALDIYADETCAKGEFGEILNIESSNSRIRAELENLFFNNLNIEFNAWTWIRSFCKYGDCFLLLDHHPDYGVMHAYPLPVNEIEREEGFDPKNPFSYRYKWLQQGNKLLENWQVVQFRMYGNESFHPYGTSILEGARRVWRQLNLMEDAVMVYRVVRSPERRVFYIDVGNVDPANVPAYLELVKTNIKRSQIVDNDTGRVDLRYNPLSTDEDYFIPVRGGESTSRIETLAGGQFTGDIEDLQYIQNKLFAALKIPKSYLGYEGDISGKATLSQEDVRFARTIQRIQRIFVSELNKIAIIHLFSLGYTSESDLLNFTISMYNPSTIAEIQKLELWRTRFEVASVAQEGLLDKKFIYRHIFKLSDEDIESVEEGRRRDKLLEIELTQMEAEASAEPAPEEVPEEPESTEPPPEGEEEEVETLDSSPTSGETPITAGFDPNQQRALPNDLKGKIKRTKVYQKPESLKNHVFRMKKNGMDPRRDLGLMRTTATAPFAENKDVILANHSNHLKRFEKELKELKEFLESNKGKKIL